MQLIESLKPDVVLLDIRMPGLDGLQVAARLCERETPPAVVFCTAQDELPWRPLRPAPSAILVKPVTCRALLEALKKAERPIVCSWRP